MHDTDVNETLKDPIFKQGAMTEDECSRALKGLRGVTESMPYNVLPRLEITRKNHNLGVTPENILLELDGKEIHMVSNLNLNFDSEDSLTYATLRFPVNLKIT